MNFYTDLKDAKKELLRRRKDMALRKEVNKFLGRYKFSPLRRKPKAVLSRPIITPNFETIKFLEMAKEIKLDPLLLEYPGKLVSINRDKYLACVLRFCDEPANPNLGTISKLKIAEISKYEGKQFTITKTITGQKITDFHHALFRDEFTKLRRRKVIVDFTKWFEKTRGLKGHYYSYYLSLFIYQGILFENFFLSHSSEKAFVEKKVVPSFRYIMKTFGLKPLIVPLLNAEPEFAHHWAHYPSRIRENIAERYGL